MSFAYVMQSNVLVLGNALGKEIRSSPSIIMRYACIKPAGMLHAAPPPPGRATVITDEHNNSNNTLIEQTTPAPNQPERTNSHLFCINQVKRYDWENYLACLCINDKLLRRTAFALRAFNVELSLVRDMTTNSDRAKLRFHFWSRLIDEIVRRNNDPYASLDKDVAYYRQTPVAKELLDLFRMVEIDKGIESCLRDLVGARVSSKVLGYKQFETMRELELYCFKSNQPIYQLMWRADLQRHKHWSPNGELRIALESVSSDLGVAQGLSNVIRGIPYNSTKNCCYIPKDLLTKHSLTNRDFVKKKLDGEKIRPAVESLAQRCQELNDRAYSELKLTKNYKTIFLPRVAIQSNLNALKNCNYNICDPIVNRRNKLLPLKLKLSSIYFRMPIF